MSNQIQTFNFNQDTPVRAFLDDDGNPLFVAKDVATALGYSDTTNAIKQHCKGVAKYDTLQTSGGTQELRVIYEPDVYRLIFGSKLKSAVKFQNWVFEEVLPAIRKTGKYEALSEPKPITPQSLADLTPITPFKSHVSAADWHGNVQEGERLANLLHPLIDQLAECYYDKAVASAQIKQTITHYCGIKNLWWITLERLPTALTVLSIMKSEAMAHKKMLTRLDSNGRLALSYQTANAIGYNPSAFDGVEA